MSFLSVLLWIGLAALSVALVVLMQTRWGQSRPMRKCVVLSLWAHVLFACFAMTIRLVSDTAGSGPGRAMRVTLSFQATAGRRH